MLQMRLFAGGPLLPPGRRGSLLARRLLGLGGRRRAAALACTPLPPFRRREGGRPWCGRRSGGRRQRHACRALRRLRASAEGVGCKGVAPVATVATLLGQSRCHPAAATTTFHRVALAVAVAVAVAAAAAAPLAFLTRLAAGMAAGAAAAEAVALRFLGAAAASATATSPFLLTPFFFFLTGASADSGAARWRLASLATGAAGALDLTDLAAFLGLLRVALGLGVTMSS
mmetsp:Transcript_1343/g.4810  ORF Transcript_1343/g.4810 Transcript_1343/m.4810 type:complete len:229 (+) Transcript_1343:461-1147(+)